MSAPEFIAAPIPNTAVRWLWCCCSGLRAMQLIILGTPTPHWLCLRCHAKADYARVWGI